MLKRAQSSIEFLILVSFFLLLTIPLISLVYLRTAGTAQDASLEQAQQTLRDLSSACDSAYIQGNGSVEKITVVFPQSVQELSANGQELWFRISVSGGQTDVTYLGMANVSIAGKIGSEAGPHTLTVRSLGKEVEITEGE